MSHFDDDRKRWTSALDAFDQSLDQHRHLAETEEVLGASHWPPAELPTTPIPDELRGLAHSLLKKADELTIELNRKMIDLPPPRVRRRPPRAAVEHARVSTKL